MNMKRFLSGAVVLGLMAMPAMAGVTVTPMQGTMGNPFNNGSVSGFGWNAATGGGAGPLIGNLYDNPDDQRRRSHPRVLPPVSDLRQRAGIR